VETTFASLCSVCDALAREPSRLAKARRVADFLRALSPAEIAPAGNLLVGRPLSPTDARALAVGTAALRERRGPLQATLSGEPLTVLAVWRAFDELANVSGPASRRRRERALEGLFARADERERPWLWAILGGEMRHGVHDGIVLDGVQLATGCDRLVLDRAHQLLGDVGEVARLAVVEGCDATRRVGLRLFVPVRPMLAVATADLAEALSEGTQRFALEAKLDGVRLQLHRQGRASRVFTRRLTDVTASFPEAVSLAEQLSADAFVVEGEAVALSPDGRPRPFQDLSRRTVRRHGVETTARDVPVRVHLFDALRIGEESLLDRPYEERFAALLAIAPAESLVPHARPRSFGEAEAFYRASLAEGHEGVVAKLLDAPYAPGVRGGAWRKVKAAATLDAVILAAEWGSGRRRGWLSNYHLGVRAADGAWAMVGKTYQGPTDALFEELTERLAAIAVTEEPWGVRVRPEIVVEIEYNDIQRSPRYESGHALRFARIARLRDDKRPEEASTLDDVRTLARAGGSPGRDAARLAERPRAPDDSAI